MLTQETTTSRSINPSCGSCSHSCPLERIFPLTAGFWRLRYCDDQRHSGCARKRLLDKRGSAPETLTPNGVILPSLESTASEIEQNIPVTRAR